MWDYVAETRTQYLDYLPESAYPASEGFVQPYCDSPLDSENVAENAYFNVLRHAQHYVYLMTPYLILDNEMTTELCLSAKSGVDVRIITPGIPDKPYVYYVTQSYYPELLRAGVRIYEYTPGFVHAKMFVSDGKLAIVGSANTDYRSLYLHYENCCQFFGGQIVNRVKEDFEATMAMCHEVTAEDIRRVPLYKWLAQMFPAAVCTFDVRRHGVPQKGETKLKLVVIDGQGGGFGRAIIEALRAKGVHRRGACRGHKRACHLGHAEGGGQRRGHRRKCRRGKRRARPGDCRAPGPCYGQQHAGRVHPAMAAAIAQSPAVKVLVPAAKCGVQVAGLAPKPLGELIDDAAQKILALLEQQDG